MDKSYTPQKQNKTTVVRQTAVSSYSKNTPEQVSRPILTPSNELNMLKDYQSLKIQVRQLQAKNRTLTTEIEQLLYEKTYNQNKFHQKLNFEEEAIHQFHKQKNYQLQLLQIKHDEQCSKLRRENELRADEYLRQIKHKDYQLKEKDEQNRYLQMRNQELRRDFQIINIELSKGRQINSVNNQQLTQSEFKVKKLQMHLEEVYLLKSEMQAQIRTLLDIQAEKSLTLNTLQSQLRASQDNQRRLVDKLTSLGENFAELQNHITIMKQKLMSADQSNHILTQKLSNHQLEIRQKQSQILQQNERESHLRLQLEEYHKRETRRQRQVLELMNENQRLYKELNINRHRLHQFGIRYGIDV